MIHLYNANQIVEGFKWGGGVIKLDLPSERK